jgi:TonB family protein
MKELQCAKVSPMQLALSKWIRVALAAMFTLSVCSSAPAQEPQIDALAGQMAASLSHANLKTVMAFDFVGPDEMDALGQKLAEDFRAALIKSAPELRVEDRSRMLELLKKNSLSLSNLHDDEVTKWLGRQSGTDAWISGALSSGTGVPKVTVMAFRAKNSDQISKFETDVPLSNDLRALIGKSEAGGFASLPESGKNGYSYPSCIHCPYAQFSAEATTRKFSGTVALEATVDEEGRVKDIKITQGLPLGLTLQAIKAVQEWQFKPATGPDGKPAAVRQKIQVTFNSY